MKLRFVAMLSLAALVLTAVGVSGSVMIHRAEAASGSGTLFGTDSRLGNLITVDPTTGVGNIVGPLIEPAGQRFPFVFPSIAVAPTTGTVMFVGGGRGDPEIFTVDPGSGSLTFVGDTGLGFASIAGMDFSTDATLYAAVNIAGIGGTGSDHLATINPTTGQGTIVGPFGTCVDVTVPSDGFGECTIEGIEGIAFDASGTLWGSHSARGVAGPPGLYQIDITTGAAIFVAPILDAAGAPASGGVVSLQFACDGTLFGGTATAVPPLTDGGRLITIDPATGAFTFVGAVSATGGVSLGGLAFATPCPVIRVGGTTSYLTDGSDLELGLVAQSGSLTGSMEALVNWSFAAAIAGGLGAMIGGGWYARRRWLGNGTGNLA